MQGISSTSNRRSIVAEYQPLNKVKDARLSKLMGDGNATPIQVPSKNFEMMKKALGVMQHVGYEVFPDGPGNQKSSINTSGGRSWARMVQSRDDDMDRASLDNRIQNKILQKIAKTGGGSCGEYSRVVSAKMSELSRELPVFRVLEMVRKGADGFHGYNVIGDWRDRTVGDNAIVVDAWQGIKKVHTFGERAVKGTPQVSDTLLPGDPLPHAEETRKALSEVPIDSETMDQVVSDLSGMDAGPVAAFIIRLVLNKSNSLWDSVSSTSNLNSTYQSPDGQQSAFDDAPADYLKKYLNDRFK